MSHSDEWMLIYGIEKANKWLLQDDFCSLPTPKQSDFSKNGFWHCIESFTMCLKKEKVLSYK